MGKHFGIESMNKDAFSHMFSKPALFETGADLMVSMVPIWVAIVIGLVVGWTWKPRWVSFMVLGLRTRQRFLWSTPPGFGARRIWLALTAITAFPFLKEMWSKLYAWRWPDAAQQRDEPLQREGSSDFSAGGNISEWALTNEDLIDICKRLECKDGGAPWNILMDRSADGMFYQAWRREPVDGIGPTEYRSRTVFENVAVEELRDFFWDDEFRENWDDMLISSKTWESCPRTGSMVVQWVRKFPVFCKDREYTIGRRIWYAGGSYYCVTKGIHYPNVPRRNAPRRVDNYFSSWRIRAVDSSDKNSGRLPSCEVMLFHHEDMGIQRDLAKLGIRQGMWGCVKKMGPGIKLYQEHRRRRGKHLSASARLAAVFTKVPSKFVRMLALPDTPAAAAAEDGSNEAIQQFPDKAVKAGCLRWFVLGGAVALACGVDKGSVGKILVFGLARRFGNMSERRRVKG